MVSVKIRPFVSQIDEIVRISVVGLSGNQKVTLRAKLTGDKGQRFDSFAHYIADEQGTVCVSSQPSVGGSYTGVEPMGLLWSMKPSPGQKKGIRLLKRDVAKAYVASVDVLNGHLLPGEKGIGDEPLLSSATFERRYMKDGVRRIPVREGRIRGTLFLPPGDGPFPGVIDWFGTLGGLLETKAPLLASHGFAALSLAYFNFEDLPERLVDVDMQYFEEAAQWMTSLQDVCPGGIGIMSVSGGCQYALSLAIRRPDLVRAVVAISPLSYLVDPKWSDWQHLHNPMEMVEQRDDGALIIQRFFLNELKIRGEDPKWLIPVEQLSSPVMFVYGEDDANSASEMMVKKMCKRMQKHSKEHLCTSLGYPGAGHLIEPPYNPHCSASFITLGPINLLMAWGGNPASHAHAQEDSWFKILEFFRKNLTTKPSSQL